MMMVILVSMMNRRTLRTINAMLVSEIKPSWFLRSAETTYNVRKLENTLQHSPFCVRRNSKNKSDFI